MCWAAAGGGGGRGRARRDGGGSRWRPRDRGAVVGAPRRRRAAPAHRGRGPRPAPDSKWRSPADSWCRRVRDLVHPVGLCSPRNCPSGLGGGPYGLRSQRDAQTVTAPTGPHCCAFVNGASPIHFGPGRTTHRRKGEIRRPPNTPERPGPRCRRRAPDRPPEAAPRRRRHAAVMVRRARHRQRSCRPPRPRDTHLTGVATPNTPGRAAAGRAAAPGERTRPTRITRSSGRGTARRYSDGSAGRGV